MPTDPTPPLTVRDVLAAWLTMVGEPRKPSITFTAEGDAVRKMEREILDALTAPTPPLTAERLAVAEQCFSSGDSGAGVEAIGRELLAAHAALTAENRVLAGKLADIEADAQATTTTDTSAVIAALTAELEALKLARREDAAEMQQDEMRYAAQLAQRTAERDALMSGVADWLDNYTQWAQLIDGWRQDGSDWSEWDEATRQQMAKVALRLSALLAAPTEG